MIFAEDWKFRGSLERVRQIVEQRSLWFSTPQQFNDPFDCQIDIDGTFAAIRGLLPVRHNARLTDLVEGARRHAEIHKYAYLCTCGIWDEILMWSHYADSHRGVALGFSFSADSPFNFRELNYREVVYSSNALKDAIAKSNDALNLHMAFPWQYPGLMAGEADAIFDMLRFYGLELYEAIRYMKAECWKYERERRYEIEIAEGIGIARPFAPSDLKHVVVGINFPQQDITSLRNLFLGEEWQHVHFWRAIPDAVSLKLGATSL